MQWILLGAWIGDDFGEEKFEPQDECPLFTAYTSHSLCNPNHS